MLNQLHRKKKLLFVDFLSDNFEIFETEITNIVMQFEEYLKLRNKI